MTSLSSRSLAALALSCAALLAPTPARADDIEEHHKGAFGTDYSVLDLAFMTASGTRRGSGDIDYSRQGAQLEYRVGAFFDENYFKTLLGAEAQIGLGYQGENSFKTPEATAVPPGGTAPIPVAPPSDNTDKGAYYFRLDAAFTYGLFRWKKGIPGRIVLGAGGGFEYAPRFRGAEGAEGYALLFGRLQLWPTKSLGVHLTATTNVGSYRFDGLVNVGMFTAGARVRLLNATRSDLTQERQYEAIVGIMF